MATTFNRMNIYKLKTRPYTCLTTLLDVRNDDFRYGTGNSSVENFIQSLVFDIVNSVVDSANFSP